MINWKWFVSGLKIDWGIFAHKTYAWYYSNLFYLISPLNSQFKSIYISLFLNNPNYMCSLLKLNGFIISHNFTFRTTRETKKVSLLFVSSSIVQLERNGMFWTLFRKLAKKCSIISINNIHSGLVKTYFCKVTFDCISFKSSNGRQLDYFCLGEFSSM